MFNTNRGIRQSQREEKTSEAFAHHRKSYTTLLQSAKRKIPAVAKWSFGNPRPRKKKGKNKQEYLQIQWQIIIRIFFPVPVLDIRDLLSLPTW